MVRAKKNIIWLLRTIVASILIIAFLESNLGVCVNIRRAVKMAVPVLNGRRELVVNIFIGIFGSSFVGSFAFIIDFFDEKKSLPQIWRERFIEDYYPLLLKMGKGTLTAEDIFTSKLLHDLYEIADNKKYMGKSSLSMKEIDEIAYVIDKIYKIFTVWEFAEQRIAIADICIKNDKACQEEFRSGIEPEEKIRDFYRDEEMIQLLLDHNEKCRNVIEELEKEIIRWNDFRADWENRIHHNMREVLVGELYRTIEACCTSAGCPLAVLRSLHNQEINRRINAGETTENQIIAIADEDFQMPVSFAGEEALP